MIEITSHRQGAILNRHHGEETSDGLKITVRGISESGRPVRVNGVPARMDGRGFSVEVALTGKVNTVTASVTTPYGVYSQELQLVWDKRSFRRFNCYLDDHSFVFTELTRQRPKRAFDHFYLAGLKRIHDETGLKVTLNAFYRNDHDPAGFLLKEMPDIWKTEFADNADWLKFSFHSYSEFPDRPYLESSGEEIGRDYDLVKNEIVRFAGEGSFIAPLVIHWANIHPSAAAEIIRRGTRCYCRSFRARVMGGPSLAERQKGGDMAQVQQRALAGRNVSDEGLRMHYDYPEDAQMFGELAGCMGADTPEAAAEKFRIFVDCLALERPVVHGEGDFEILKNSVNPVRLKNNPVRLDADSIDLIYHHILGE